MNSLETIVSFIIHMLLHVKMAREKKDFTKGSGFSGLGFFDATDGDGCTSLMIACAEGEASCVSALLPHCTPEQISATNNLRWTALMIACYDGYRACVSIILAYDPPELYVCPRTLNALLCACLQGQRDCVAELLVYGVPHQVRAAKTREGMEILEVARSRGHDICASAVLNAVETMQLARLQNAKFMKNSKIKDM